MQISTLALLAASSATLAAAFEYNIYTDTACTDLLQIWSGNNTGAAGQPGATYNMTLNTYAGSVTVVSEDSDISEMDLFASEYDYTCLYYDLACCLGASTCDYDYSTGYLVVHPIPVVLTHGVRYRLRRQLLQGVIVLPYGINGSMAHLTVGRWTWYAIHEQTNHDAPEMIKVDVLEIDSEGMEMNCVGQVSFVWR
jgi:hypothetical protein